MTTKVKTGTHKTKLITAMLSEISIKAKKETADPNKSKSEIGKETLGIGCCKRVCSIQVMKNAITMYTLAEYIV